MGRLTAAPLSLLISIAIFSFSGRVDGWTVDALYPYGVSFQFSVFYLFTFLLHKQVLPLQLLPAEHQLCTCLIIKLGGDV